MRIIFYAVIALSPGATALRADVPSPGGGLPSDSWSFSNTNWFSDLGFAPLRYTNLVFVPEGDGKAMLLDTSNTVPAYLVYPTIESDGTNELTIPTGTISLWFNPRWSGTNAGGAGPSALGRLIELGNYTTNASVGWLSLYISTDGTMVYFAGQTNNGSQGTYLSAPVHFVSNNWYNLVLTYSPTNSAFYTNGVLVTNGTGVAYYPPPGVLSNGFSLGSSASNTVSQARGLFDDVVTYNYPLDPATISGDFSVYGLLYGLTNFLATNSAPFVPAIVFGDWSVTAGPGWLISSGSVSGCVTSATPPYITEWSAVPAYAGFTFTFGISGGSNNVAYDVFMTTDFENLGTTNAQWNWMGQGTNCGKYSLTNQPQSGALYMLATSPDSDGDGLPNDYELLVSHTDPGNMFSNPDGVPEGWKVLHRLNPQTAGLSGLDPDHDGLTNGQEYLYGTDPLVSEGMSVWVGVPAGYSGIP